MATSARLDELKKKFDENPRRYFAPLANEYRKLGDLTQAIALCRAHLPNQPGHISGHIVLAQALYEARELGEARSIFEASLDLDPENLIALRYLGDIAREQGEPASARTWYERVLDADPRNEEIAALLKEIELAPLATAEADAPAVGADVPTFGDTAIAEEATSLAHAEAVEPPAEHEESFEASPVNTAFQSNEVSGAYDAFPSDDPHAAIPLASSLPTMHEALPPIDASAPFPEDAAAATASHADDPFFGSSTHESTLAMGELEAVAEPSVDDWFGASADALAPGDAAVSASDPAAFDDSFFPDLASATPVASSAVPEPVVSAFPTPLEVDVQAPTPPFVRAEEPRAPLPTPAFLSAVDARDAFERVEEPAAPSAGTEDEAAAESTPEFVIADVAKVADVAGVADAADTGDAPVVTAFVSAYESEHRVETPVAEGEPVPEADASDAPIEAAVAPEEIDWRSAPTPVDSPAIPEWSATEAETIASLDEVELAGDFADEVAPESSEAEGLVTAEAPEAAPASEVAEVTQEFEIDTAEPMVAALAPEPQPEMVAEAVAEFAASPSPVVDETAEVEAEVEAEVSDFSAWIAEEPASEVTTASNAELEGEPVAELQSEPAFQQPESAVEASSDLTESVVEATTEFETEETLASYAHEVAEQTVSSDFELDDHAFVPPAADDVPFIANSIAVPLDESDAYSAGAPELSAHEPFPIEAAGEADIDLTVSPLAGWGDAVAEGGDEPGPIDAHVSPIEGLVSRETPADLAAISASVDHEPLAEADAAVPTLGDANDAVPEPAYAASAAGQEPESQDAPTFVTETMAELYLQQGFHEEALSIYRQLLAQQPHDPVLRERIAALERGAHSSVVAGIVPRDTIDRAGQSVRSFFLHFARREPRRPASQSGDEDGESSDPHGGAEATAERTPTFSGVATREEALTVPDPTVMSTSAPETATLSDLFAAGAVSGADDRAAASLASAFGGGEGAPSGGGSERELSLEHLFRDVPERSSGAVTLDEFYEGSSPGSSAPHSPGGEGGEERDADIEQFTAWLEGLKKK